MLGAIFGSKNPEREVVTKTQITEVEKTVEVPVAPKFSVLTPKIPLYSNDKKDKDGLMRRDLIQLENNMVIGFNNLNSSMNANKEVYEKISMEAHHTNDRFIPELEKVKKAVVDTVNQLQTNLQDFRETVNVRDNGINTKVDRIAASVTSVKEDRLIDLKGTLDPFFVDLTHRLSAITMLPEIKADLEASTYVYKEVRTLLEGIEGKFDSIKSVVEAPKNEVTFDPEIKFYYLSFTEKLKEMGLLIDRIRDLEYKIDSMQHKYDDKVSARIDDMEAKFNKAVGLIGQTVETFQVSLQNIKYKDNENKVPVLNVNNNQTTNISNRTSFVSLHSFLPDPALYKGKEIFVKKSEFVGWFNWNRKGYYVSDGSEWIRI